MLARVELTPEVTDSVAKIGIEEEKSESQLSPASALERWIDFLLPLLIVVALLVHCELRSPKKELWVDEAYSLALVTDPSFAHAMSALYNAADGGMPLYYVFANPWAHLFGTSLLALRLFTSISVALGMLLVWRLLRGRYSAQTAAISVLAVGLSSGLLLYQDVELRYYGVFFLCAALVLTAHQWLTGVGPSSKLLLWVWLTHALLVYSHPFGVIYSAAAILGMVVAERKHLRWKIYFTLASSWLTLLPWYPAIRRVQDFAKPHNYVDPPTLADVWECFSQSVSLPCVLLGLSFVAGIFLISRASGPNSPTANTDSTLLAQSFCIVLLPLAVAIESRVGTALFVQRYFLPSIMGAAVLFAYAVDCMLLRVKLTPPIQAVFAILLIALLMLPIYSAATLPPEQDYRVTVEKFGASIPILVENTNLFLPLDYYSYSRFHLRPYYVIVDWDSALRAPSRQATVQAKILQRLRAAHYHEGQILDSADALCRFDQFIVLHDWGWAWFHDNIQQDPAFAKEQIMTGRTSAWLVTRISSSGACNAN